MFLTVVFFHCVLCYLFIVGYFLVRAFSRMNGKILLLHRNGEIICYLFIVGYFLVRTFSGMNGKILLLHRTGK